MRGLILAGAAMATIGGVAVAQPARPDVAYQLQEGQNLNAFFRAGPSAAHLLLRSGRDPRILVAFPAGNSGVGLWFEQVTADAAWRLESPPRAVTLKDARGRPLHGIEAVATVEAPRLVPKQALLTSVRFLRDYQSIGKFPPEVAVPVRVEGDRLVWARDRADGAPGYRLEVQVLGGRIAGGAILAAGDGRIRLRIVAASGETPMVGLSEAELLTARAAPDPAARRALAFLSYREKYLAGSWRFNTYFGRDTLMSLRLLLPVLRGAAVEDGLMAVLARLDREGSVAHEEGIGEFAVIEHRRAGGTGDAATLDYGMVDDDYMLLPVAAAYLQGAATPAAAAAFLGRPVASVAEPGRREPVGALLARNIRFVLDRARPFAERPEWDRLVAIHPGRMTGEWRDSEEGMGRGRYSYNVNGVFVPAALEAAAGLLRSGLLDRYLAAGERDAAARAETTARVWRDKAPGLFRVDVPSGEATAAVKRYADRIGVPAAPALAALGDAPLSFHALSLDERGRPVPIVNSDEGFALLFTDPAPAELDTYVTAAVRPFPAGLMTDVGMLVANAAQADTTVQDRFSPAAYHGAVVWSWQQALFAAGLERQLARKDLPPATRARLVQAQATLWRAILAARATQNSELWSWAYEDGRYRVVPFGAGKADVDESNAAQLWSTVYLAVRPPAGMR